MDGEYHPHAKLSYADVAFIREVYSKGSRGIGIELAQMFRVSRSCISQIVNWKLYIGPRDPRVL